MLDDKLNQKGIVPTAEQKVQGKQYIAEAMERGILNVAPPNAEIAQVTQDFIDAHGQSFRVAFVASAVIALLGVLSSWGLVRKVPGPVSAPVFTRRSRWLLASAGGTTPGLTRVPPSVVEPGTHPVVDGEGQDVDP